MKFAQLPTDTFKQIQLGAGILLSEFDPTSPTIDKNKILGATSGGIQFTATDDFSDFGKDIDNCPNNTYQLKRITSRSAKMSGTFVTMSAATAKIVTAAADIPTSDITNIVPRNQLVESDFSTVWLVADYSDLNGPTNGGFCAIKMINSLSTGGFRMQTTENEKGKFAFEFTAHYDINNIDTVPYSIYIKAGTAE